MTPEAVEEGDPLALYNGNGRITCAEARRYGIAPVHSDHPVYEFMQDGMKMGWCMVGPNR